MEQKYTYRSVVARDSFKDPPLHAKSKYSHKWRSPNPSLLQKSVLLFIGVFISFANIVMSAAPPPLQFLENYAVWLVKTCSRCPTILMLLFISKSEWCIFVLGPTRRIQETALYEPSESEGWGVVLHATAPDRNTSSTDVFCRHFLILSVNNS
jgi:hypothetical protein